MAHKNGKSLREQGIKILKGLGMTGEEARHTWRSMRFRTHPPHVVLSLIRGLARDKRRSIVQPSR